MKKISQVTALWWLCIAFIFTNIATILCFAAEHEERVKYEQSACVLADVCHSALDCENLDATSFEELYEDALCNTDCYGLCVDREFIDSLYWAYLPGTDKTVPVLMRADESWQIKTKQFYIAPPILYRGPHTLGIELTGLTFRTFTCIKLPSLS